MSWSARNRITQSAMIQQDAGDVPGGGESGQTYGMRIYIDGVLIHTLAGLGTSYTYTGDARGLDDPDYSKPVRIEIFSNANALDSLFAQVFTLRMSGPTGTLGSGRYEFGVVTVGGLLV
jgi:hypothetical protein